MTAVMCTMGISPSALAAIGSSSSASSVAATDTSSIAPNTDTSSANADAVLSELPAAQSEESTSQNSTIKQSIATPEGYHYTVTITYGKEANIPDDATIKLVELKQTPADFETNKANYTDRPYEYESFVSAAEIADRDTKLSDALKVRADEGDYVFMTKHLDISIMSANAIIQPSAPVQVTIETDAIERNQSNEIEAAVNAYTTTSQFAQTGYQSLAVTNETKMPVDPLHETDEEKQSRVKLSFTTDLVTELGLAGVVTPRASLRVANSDVKVLGPRSAAVTTEDAQVAGLPATMELVGSLRAVADPNPVYGTALWLSVKPSDDAASQDSNGGFSIYQVDNGELGQAISSSSDSTPVAINSGDSIAFVHEVDFENAKLELGDVVLEGSMPEGTTGEALDVTQNYADIQSVAARIDDNSSSILDNSSENGQETGDSSESDAEKQIAALAAYDISLEAAGGEYQPSAEHPIEVSISDDAISTGKNLEIWHIRDDGTVEVIKDYSIKGNSVSFKATGFSVYVIVSGGTTVTPRCTYTFFVQSDDAGGDYTEYHFKDSQGNDVTNQTVKTSGELVVPQLPPKDDKVFAGWYKGERNSSGQVVLEDKPYDFDNIVIQQDSAVGLYAVYKDYLYVTFHDQYDSSSKVFPIAYTRRGEKDGTASAKVKISDLSAIYASSGTANMAFYGWSLTPVSTPGAAKDDNGNDVSPITPDEDGCITITADTHLYPLFKNINWLTYYAAQSGRSASYVPPAYYYEGDPVSLTPEGHLPTTSREGYTFKGWYAGTLVSNSVLGPTIEYIDYASQITDENGNLVASADDGNFYISGGDLYLRGDATLYAKWSASYNVVTWKQKTDVTGSPDSEKDYEYAETFTYPDSVVIEGGSTLPEVTLPDEYKDLGGTKKYTGYSFNNMRSELSKTVLNGKQVTTLNVYYDRDDAYSPTQQKHKLTFKDSVTGTGTSTMPEPRSPIAYQESLKGYKPPDPTSARVHDGNVLYDFSGWYMDQACTIKADLDSMTMPDRDLTVYAGWTPVKFKVDIDPNYGALYYYDDEGHPHGTGSTYFSNTYDDEPIGEYTHTTRDYVASSSGSYFYVNHDRAYAGDDRYTYYTNKINEATEDTTFEYSPGTYSYVAWYEVLRDKNGNEIGEADKPYDFTQHTDHDTKLRLHWKKAGSYYLAYSAIDRTSGVEIAGTLEDKTSTDEVLTQEYADSSETVLTRTAIAPTGYTFIGWKVRGSDSTTIYAPGQTFALHADDAIRANGKDTIFLDAVYAKVDTTRVVYDANGGTVEESGVDFGKTPTGTGGDYVSASGTIDTDKNTATCAGLSNNSTFKLSGGAGFSCERNGVTYTLAGWSNKSVYDPKDSEAEFYALDGEYGVDKNEPVKLYAVWTTKATYHPNGGNLGNEWDSKIYKPGTAGTYEQTVYLGNTTDASQTTHFGGTISEPTNASTYTNADKIFKYWSTSSAADASQYDFTQTVTGPLNLYASWGSPISVNVHAVDASAAELTEIASGTGGWTISPLSVGTTSIALPGSGIVTAPSDYEVAFVAAHDKTKDVDTITEEEKVSAIVYDSAKKAVYVTYADGTSAALQDGVELYYVCYQKKTLDINYKSMATSGVLTDASATGATTVTGALGSYDMKSQITNPLGLVSGYSYYAFAVGSAGAPNASALNALTDASGLNDPSPAMLVRNTWRGFEYSTDNGSTWVNCGYKPDLYVIYYEMQPTTIVFKESTVGTSADMATPFTYNVTVTQTVTNGSESTTTTLFDTTAAGSSPYTLKNGEEQSAIVFHDENTTQTITVTQTPSANFSTALSSESGTIDQGALSWTYTSSGAAPTQTVTFTNTRNALPVEVHVAQVEEGGIIQRDNNAGDITGSRSVNESDYKFSLALGEKATLQTKISPSGVFYRGDKNTYAFGAAIIGHAASGDHSAVTVESMGIATVAYEKVDGNVYELVARDADGKSLGQVGSNDIYYLYYPMPKIKYMKDDGTGALTDITGSIKTSTGTIEPSNSITYDHDTLIMNGNDVVQDQNVEIPLKGLTFSQSGNNFRMPAILDDGMNVRYLGYSMIGAGNSGVQTVDGLSGKSSDLNMQLRIQNNALQYSFDGSTWSDLPLSGSPTIYAIYTERGYDLQIGKTIDMSKSGTAPLFADKHFTVTLSSMNITKSTYEADGADSATVEATPASGSTSGTIVLDVKDGTKVKIKGLSTGDYTITESGNENYNLTAKKGPIVGTSSTTVPVSNNSTVNFTLDEEMKVDLTNTPKAICKIIDGGTTKDFYTIQSAVDYVAANVTTGSAKIEMLVDYVMPPEDTVTIPNGCNVFLTTATSGFSGSWPATITRSPELKDVALFTNIGELTLNNIELDGASVASTKPMIQSSGNLTLSGSTAVQNAVNSGNGAAINATAGNITIFENASLKNNSASAGGAIYHSGYGTITVSGTGKIQNNTASTGNGGAIYAHAGTVDIKGSAELSGNKAENGNGGAIYGENAAVKVGENASVKDGTAKEGGAIYVEAGSIAVSAAQGVAPSITGNTATSGNGGAIWIGTGFVDVSGGSVSNNTASSGYGGAIYAIGAPVTVSGTAELKQNSSTEGGAIYADSGNVAVSGGSVESNSASAGDGGAVYAGSGVVAVSGGSVSKNTASRNGGAVYAGAGSVTVSNDASISENTAGTNGGAIYATSGKVSISTTSALTKNTATNGSGGAVYADTGSVTITDTTVSENTAGTNGGAVYADSGAVSILGDSGTSSMTNNTAGTSGGAVYADSGSVVVALTTMSGNTAAEGDGGALYAGSGATTLTDSAVFTGNKANAGKGGAVYVGSGAASLASTTSMTQNEAINGAAIFFDTGRATFTGGTYTSNIASNGGAVGVGRDTARLTFSANVNISGNTLGSGTAAKASNVYLDQDSKNVLIMAGLGSQASIGIYVPDSLTQQRDVPGARFATYTDDANVNKIVNDRYNFSVQKDTASKQLFWGMPISVEVRYQASFANGLPPNAPSTWKYTNNSYFPEFSSAAVSTLADELHNKGYYSLTNDAAYALAFVSGATEYKDYITNLAWDTSSMEWKVTKRDGTTEALGNHTIVIYYADPAYISIENNTDSALDLTTLTVGNDTIGQLNVVNTTGESGNAGYGTVYAKNGSVRPGLLPVSAADVQLAANASITLLIPGGRNMSYVLGGTFGSITGGTVRLRRGTAETPPEETVNVDSSGNFDALTDSTPNSSTTYKIIFGDDRYICKVVDAHGVENRYTTISGAISAIKNGAITLATPKTAAVEMLVDYLLPSKDKVVIPAGYDITLTTATTGTYKYDPIDPLEPRVTISRDTDNTNAMVSTENGSTDTALSITNMVFNVKGVQGSTEFGAVVANGSSVTVDHVDFKNLYAANGGAIFAQTTTGAVNSWVRVTNSYFTNCHSTKTGSRDGGGAIHAYVDKLNVADCQFDSCGADWQAGAVFHKVEVASHNANIYTESLITNCTFTDCQSQAAGGMELGAKNIIVRGCTFERCNATNRNGGGFNVYIMTTSTGGGSPNFDCWTTVENCEFNDCHLTGGSDNGGGFRSSSKYTTVVGTTFTNCSAVSNGGAVALSNTNAVKAELYGCSISDCSSKTGGGVYFVGKELVVSDSYDIDANGKPIFANGTALDVGGGLLSDGPAVGTHYVAPMTIQGCTASTVGGIYHNRDANDTKLTINNATISKNTATASAGGGVYSYARTISVTGSTISGNSAARGTGGGLNASKTTKLDLTNTTISNNSASSNGGGVWTNSGNLVFTITGCTMNGNTATDSGAAVYTTAKTVTVTDSEITNCTATKTAGGIYQSQNSDGSSLTITGSKINGCTAKGGSGGGIWSNVRTLSVSDSEISKNSATSTGGGVWFDGNNDTARALMTLAVSGCTLNGNTSNNNGGSIYTGAKTVTVNSYTYPEGTAPTSTPEVGSYITDNSGHITGRRTDISGCTGTNGGGIWHSNNIADSSLSVTNSIISGCTASNGIGGGTYANVYYATFTGSEVSGNTSSGNGGGIYKGKQNSSYYLTIDGSRITGNTSGKQGGGVYCQSKLNLRNNSEISGNRLSSSTVDNAAGVYLENNRTLFVGPEFSDTDEGKAAAAGFTDSSSITGNYTSAGADSNLHLWWDNTNKQNATASVYVYCNLDGVIGVTNAAKVGTQFGTSLISKPHGFSDDFFVFKADTSTLHGIIDRTDETGTTIIWAGPPIAKITDGNGNILYTKSVTLGDGTKKGSGPAVFDKLSAANDDSHNTTSAFGMLNTASPQLYTADGELYTGNSYCIKMLVETFTSESILYMNNYSAGRTLVFTTADPRDTDEYPGPTSGRSTVMRGSGTGNNNFLYVNTGVNLTISNIVIDGGSLNGITANGNTRNLNINNGGAHVTLGEAAILQNASVSGNNGGGVIVNNGSTFTIAGGTIRNCSTNRDGGGVYIQGNSNSTFTFTAGTIYQCRADNGSGGGVRLSKGTINMSGGTIRGCSATNGGGVYLTGDSGNPMYMSGGSIVGNNATKVGGGIAFYNQNSGTRIYLWQKVTISGNTCDASVAPGNACNIELNRDAPTTKNGVVQKDSIIHTNGTGLWPGSYVGVYVPDTYYSNHGVEGKPFATFSENDNTINLYSFVNDRNGLKGGIIENPSPNTVYWIQIFSLQVKKDVEDSASNPADPDETFHFKVNIRGNATVTGQLNAKDIDSRTGYYGEMEFTSNGTDTTTAEFDLKAGESVTAVNLSEGLDYEVIEELSDEVIEEGKPAQKDKYVALPATVCSGKIGENKEKTGVDPYTSLVDITDQLPVCKITDNGGNLLYRRYIWHDQTFYVPAAFTELTGDKGAFHALTETLYVSSGNNPTSYSVSNGVQIQMLIQNYTQQGAVTLQSSLGGPVTLATASSAAEKLPYQGPSGTVATVKRGFESGSMYTAQGPLTLSSIALDGAKSDYTVTSQGGIVNVPSGGSLTIQNGAILQNSMTDANGGAVYVANGGTVNMTGGFIQKNEVTSSADGAGVYLEQGSRMNLSGNLDFGGTGTDIGGNIVVGNGNYKQGTIIGRTNGKKSYEQARQDIYLAGYAADDDVTNAASLNVNGNITADDGSIWVWAAESPHYKSLQQFATIANSVTDSEGTCGVFRNARFDTDTLNETDSYLHGIRKNGTYIYWYGVEGGQNVVLRKVNESNDSLNGAVFDVLQSDASTVVRVDGVALSGLTSSSTGVIWVGQLPYGRYYLHETSVPGGYATLNDGTNWYSLVITEDGITYDGPLTSAP